MWPSEVSVVVMFLLGCLVASLLQRFLPWLRWGGKFWSLCAGSTITFVLASNFASGTLALVCFILLGLTVASFPRSACELLVLAILSTLVVDYLVVEESGVVLQTLRHVLAGGDNHDDANHYHQVSETDGSEYASSYHRIFTASQWTNNVRAGAKLQIGSNELHFGKEDPLSVLYSGVHLRGGTGSSNQRLPEGEGRKNLYVPSVLILADEVEFVNLHIHSTPPVLEGHHHHHHHRQQPHEDTDTVATPSNPDISGAGNTGNSVSFITVEGKSVFFENITLYVPSTTASSSAATPPLLTLPRGTVLRNVRLVDEESGSLLLELNGKCLEEEDAFSGGTTSKTKKFLRCYSDGGDDGGYGGETAHPSAAPTAGIVIPWPVWIRRHLPTTNTHRVAFSVASEFAVEAWPVLRLVWVELRHLCVTIWHMGRIASGDLFCGALEGVNDVSLTPSLNSPHNRVTAISSGAPHWAAWCAARLRSDDSEENLLFLLSWGWDPLVHHPDKEQSPRGGQENHTTATATTLASATTATLGLKNPSSGQVAVKWVVLALCHVGLPFFVRSIRCCWAVEWCWTQAIVRFIWTCMAGYLVPAVVNGAQFVCRVFPHLGLQGKAVYVGDAILRGYKWYFLSFIDLQKFFALSAVKMIQNLCCVLWALVNSCLGVVLTVVGWYLNTTADTQLMIFALQTALMVFFLRGKVRKVKSSSPSLGWLKGVLGGPTAVMQVVSKEHKGIIKYAFNHLVLLLLLLGVSFVPINFLRILIQHAVFPYQSHASLFEFLRLSTHNYNPFFAFTLAGRIVFTVLVQVLIADILRGLLWEAFKILLGVLALFVAGYMISRRSQMLSSGPNSPAAGSPSSTGTGSTAGSPSSPSSATASPASSPVEAAPGHQQPQQR